jgi:hypothetical protein
MLSAPLALVAENPVESVAAPLAPEMVASAELKLTLPDPASDPAPDKTATLPPARKAAVVAPA